MTAPALVPKLRNYWNILRDDGLSFLLCPIRRAQGPSGQHGDYAKQSGIVAEVTRRLSVGEGLGEVVARLLIATGSLSLMAGRFHYFGGGTAVDPRAVLEFRSKPQP